MSQMMNLKEAERRAWTLYFEDGLWDLFFGFLFLAGGLRTLTDSLWAYLLVVAGILIFIVGRRVLTLPRLGGIKFGPKRQARRQKLMILILVALALTLAVLLLPVLGVATPGAYAGLIFAAIVPLILAVVAYFMDFRRLYGYAVLVAIFMMLMEMVSLQAGAMAEIVAGSIALLIGSWHLLHFMKEYPLPDEAFMGEGNNDGQS
jgi:MFS family permease